MEITIITGLSGAGKSGAIDCFEDMGYFCIDNMPPSLIKNFIELTRHPGNKKDKIAFVIDIRGGEFFSDLADSLADLKKSGYDYKILFLEASTDVLIRRYSEKRRNHPLHKDEKSTLAAIEREREVLLSIKKISDYVIDTSELKPVELNMEIKEMFMPNSKLDTMELVIMSFGYKYGIPKEVDIVLDMRFIKNPFYVDDLKEKTGNDPEVRDYVMRNEASKVFKDRAMGLLEYLLPFYLKEGKPKLFIALGCTGGQHRSVTMANEIFEDLSSRYEDVSLIHRDI